MHNAIQTSILVAYRAFEAPTTTDTERDAILAALIECFDGERAECASRILFHRREAASRQLQLGQLLDGGAR